MNVSAISGDAEVASARQEGKEEKSKEKKCGRSERGQEVSWCGRVGWRQEDGGGRP